MNSQTHTVSDRNILVNQVSGPVGTQGGSFSVTGLFSDTRQIKEYVREGDMSTT